MALSIVFRSSNICDYRIFELLVDSLTQELFKGPVIDPHGATLETKFITRSPLQNYACSDTQQHLQAYRLLPNKAFQHVQDQLFNGEGRFIVKLQKHVSILNKGNTVLVKRVKDLITKVETNDLCKRSSLGSGGSNDSYNIS